MQAMIALVTHSLNHTTHSRDNNLPNVGCYPLEAITLSLIIGIQFTFFQPKVQFNKVNFVGLIQRRDKTQGDTVYTVISVIPPAHLQSLLCTQHVQLRGAAGPTRASSIGARVYDQLVCQPVAAPSSPTYAHNSAVYVRSCLQKQLLNRYKLVLNDTTFSPKT